MLDVESVVRFHPCDLVCLIVVCLWEISHCRTKTECWCDKRRPVGDIIKRYGSRVGHKCCSRFEGICDCPDISVIMILYRLLVNCTIQFLIKSENSPHNSVHLTTVYCNNPTYTIQFYTFDWPNIYHTDLYIWLAHYIPHSSIHFTGPNKIPKQF